MMTEEIIELVRTIGLPGTICLYFIFKVERVVENNTKALTLFLNEVKSGNRK